MRNYLISLTVLLGLSLPASFAFAQSTDDQSIDTHSIGTAPQAAVIAEGNPDYCIDIMAGFPVNDQEARYQFFRLTEDMARDATPEFRRALSHYGDGNVSRDTPILDVIEIIANPVLRQAAPEITIANMAHVIDFASTCEPFITGQINSLQAYDAALADVSFNAVITEDALFLRQVLSDSLFRLGASENPAHSFAVNQYVEALVATRDQAEFVSFEEELEGLEALYLTDLDGRLKRSNDIINEEVDREVLSESITLSDSLNAARKKQAKERQIFTLIRILGGG